MGKKHKKLENPAPIVDNDNCDDCILDVPTMGNKDDIVTVRVEHGSRIYEGGKIYKRGDTFQTTRKRAHQLRGDATIIDQDNEKALEVPKNRESFFDLMLR